MAQYAAGYAIAWGIVGGVVTILIDRKSDRDVRALSSRRCDEPGFRFSLREYLGFLEGVAAGLVTYDAEGFLLPRARPPW